MYYVLQLQIISSKLELQLAPKLKKKKITLFAGKIKSVLSYTHLRTDFLWKDT